MATALWDTVFTGINEPTQGQVGDWPIADPEAEPENQGGLQDVDGLRTAMALALFTDAKLPDHFIDQYGFTPDDQHEWHGNTFGFEDDEEPLGSLLWTIERMPLNEDTARLVEHFAAEALQTLVRQKLVSMFDITTEIIMKPRGRINLFIIAYTTGGQISFFADLYPLQ